MSKVKVSGISRKNLVDMIDKQTNTIQGLICENEKLRDALKRSQQVMNTFGLIHGNGKFSKSEKCQRADKLIEIHMDDIFTVNKSLLAKLNQEGEE
ncbi:coil containing protein [Vibrio phage 455E52-1]|nr:coil containing protein [Vibrio phage 455E52-1]